MKVLILLFVVLLAGCGKGSPQKSSTTKQNVSGYFAATELKVKVYYEPGSEPYTSDVLIQYWTLLESNLKALFTGRKNEPLVSVPKTLSEMTVLTSTRNTSWTIDEVLDLAKTQGKGGDSSTFEIYFVNGYAAESKYIIGFHINGTRTIVIFKDVIRSTGEDAIQAVPKFVEQATIIHEMGHALGLVNNGVAMVESHQDKEHGAHCSNPDCVMYYTNEGASALKTFAEKFINSGSTVMFDDKCLKDTRSF